MISTVLANRVCFKLFFSNLQRCNRVLPESKPGSSQRSEHANLEHSLRMQLSRLIPSCLTNKREDQSTNDDPQDDANVHKGPTISTAAGLSRTRARLISLLFESSARQPPVRQSRYGGRASLAPPIVAAAFLFVIPGGVEESLLVVER